MQANKEATVFCQTSFEAIHCYPEAPEEVAYLRAPHRHMFGVRVEMQVFNDDREVEFIMLKHRVEDFLKSCFSGNIGRTSCEQIAAEVVEQLEYTYCADQNRNIKVTVDEDGENGSTVYVGSWAKWN